MCLFHTEQAPLALSDEDAYQAYRDQLVAAGYLVPLSVRGLYARAGAFERIVEAFDAYVTRQSAHLKAEVLRFPPIFARANYERIDHIRNFPDLMGSVHVFKGGDREHQRMLESFERRGNWSAALAPGEAMLIPAACYSLYPTATGTLPEGGRQIDLESFVFRHEPSDDPARMQVFRQREFVRLGSPEEALAHRNDWLSRGLAMLEALGLKVRKAIAHDPFFGRGAKLLKATQREQDLKYELLVPICSSEEPTAVASCNYHLDHFGLAFDIRTSRGETAHSACIGFGLERVTLALLKTHGLNLQGWPREVRDVLALD